MRKPVIAVDFDDVILDEAAFVIDYSNKTWGYQLSLDDYRENWREMWGLEDGPQFDTQHAALTKPGIQLSYDFIDGVEAALRQLAKRFRLVVLTSRSGDVANETIEWIERTLPGVFSDVHLTGFYDDKSPDRFARTKGVIAQEISAEYLIDDQPRHCFAAAEEGVKALLFGDYAVSKDLELPAHVTRCKDWAAVLKFFEK